MKQHLGHQLDQISNRQLTERISELTEANRRLEHELAQLRPLQDQVQRLQKGLDAARNQPATDDPGGKSALAGRLCPAWHLTHMSQMPAIVTLLAAQSAIGRYLRASSTISSAEAS
ncbi:hypothetical protein [Streptomyces sp. NPDC097610]|uniref:hypothetical protein n=1 Tax=Streptomyces sp. NPDC097610 TaxID=3157227 RepID=UPI00332C19FE